jgi:PKD repeat protein
MKPLLKIIIVICTVFFFFGCKKETLTPSSTENQPVFSFSGNINNNSVNWQAGLNNYFMYSSYTQSSSTGVYSYTGTLQKMNSSNGSLQITVNNYRTLALGASEPYISDSSLVKGYYSLNKPGGTSTAYSVQFVPVLGGASPTSYYWDFGDGNSSTLWSPVHTYTHPGDYHTKVSAVFSCGNETDSNIVKSGSYDAARNINFISVTNGGSPNKMQFSTLYSGAVKSITWNFGDGKDTVSHASDSIVHTYASAGMYLISATIVDTDMIVSTYNENIVTTGYSDSCIINYTTVVSAVANSDALSNITIVYTDDAGNVYSSSNPLQPSTSSFKINSVSPYKSNNNGQNTMMLNVSFNCLLFNGSNVINANGTATTAVAYH